MSLLKKKPVGIDTGDEEEEMKDNAHISSLREQQYSFRQNQNRASFGKENYNFKFRHSECNREKQSLSNVQEQAKESTILIQRKVTSRDILLCSVSTEYEVETTKSYVQTPALWPSTCALIK